ncbi:uncharacterized protein LOC111014601 [Momordica charantia]|uniref:Uncharacterized protein LOC111014601 n=1 Tax=Momordica charantia TaxID=3673 RepID=A0A6J1CTH8_MOMCH|nr:uncharacterized protein LOC111014601 [Momordica charantia]
MGKLQENQPGSQNGCCRAIMEEDFEASMESSMEFSSEISDASSSLDMVEEDVLSPTSNSSLSSSSSNGPFYELSELMAHLPMKRGLSKYYDGKSESFTSLASVVRLEDLAKRVSPIRKKMKSCKSFGGGFDAHKSIIPRATIAKKASRSRRKTSLLSGSRSAISVNGN